jgi:hypothetical protein
MKPCPFCGSEARIYSNRSFAKGCYAQARCKNKACSARGPLMAKPYPYVPWTVEHQAKDYAERREMQRAAEEKLKAEIRDQARLSWNERVQSAPGDSVERVL